MKSSGKSGRKGDSGPRICILLKWFVSEKCLHIIFNEDKTYLSKSQANAVMLCYAVREFNISCKIKITVTLFMNTEHLGALLCVEQ